jgi:hypothetical protein
VTCDVNLSGDDFVGTDRYSFVVDHDGSYSHARSMKVEGGGRLNDSSLDISCTTASASI